MQIPFRTDCEVHCNLCGPGVPFSVRYPPRLTESELDFRARKLPLHQHFRIVECETCGLVYSNPIVSPKDIQQLYKESPFIEEPQLENIRHDYRREVERLLPLLPQRNTLLEVGCANGFFLEDALRLGFKSVRGIEPGEDAVRRASRKVRRYIINAEFDASYFEPQSFDLICAFQIFDHALDPLGILRGMVNLLRPGGLVLLLNHNIRSWFPRVLGRTCPMYDVFHVYLFDQKTVRLLFEKVGLRPLYARNILNSYTVEYCFKMFPLPSSLKRGLSGVATGLGLSQRNIRLSAGNMVAVAKKSEAY